MNWFQRHLNYGWILLSLCGTLLVAFIASFFVDLEWHPGLFGGFEFVPYLPSIVTMSTLEVVVMLALEYFLNMIASLTAGWWVLRQKSRSLWWLLIILVPLVGWIVFLCLKNRSQISAKTEIFLRD